MTEQEAIKRFKERLEKHSHRNIVPEYLKAMEMAIKALEKQIARKPITYNDTNRADCPICKATVRAIKEPFGNWCSICGQKLDWGEEE